MIDACLRNSWILLPSVAFSCFLKLFHFSCFSVDILRHLWTKSRVFFATHVKQNYNKLIYMYKVSCVISSKTIWCLLRLISSSYRLCLAWKSWGQQTQKPPWTIQTLLHQNLFIATLAAPQQDSKRREERLSCFSLSKLSRYRDAELTSVLQLLNLKSMQSWGLLSQTDKWSDHSPRCTIMGVYVCV